MERMKEYDVLKTNRNHKDECSYIVRHKGNNFLYACKAIDLGRIEDNKKQLLISEINSLLSLKHSLNTIRCFEYIFHTSSDTLYVITEYLKYDLQALINQSKNNRTFIDETFIWKLLYQIAKAFDAYNTISTAFILFNGHISPRNVYLDSNFNVKVDFFVTANGLLQTSKERYKTSCSNQDAICRNNEKITTRWLSYIIYHIIALHKYKPDQTIKPRTFKRYSKSLQNMVSMLYEETTSISSLIHHPNIVSNLYLDATPKLNDNTLRRRTKEKGELNQENNKENMNTLQSLRKRETIIEEKEKELQRREKDIYKKEQEINIMEIYVKDKLLRVQNLEKCSLCKHTYGDLDSTTCSGDAGDTSVQQTTSKLNPKNIMQPLFTNTMKKRINKSKFKSTAAIMTYL